MCVNVGEKGCKQKFIHDARMDLETWLFLSRNLNGSLWLKFVGLSSFCKHVAETCPHDLCLVEKCLIV